MRLKLDILLRAFMMIHITFEISPAMATNGARVSLSLPSSSSISSTSLSVEVSFLTFSFSEILYVSPSEPSLSLEAAARPALHQLTFPFLLHIKQYSVRPFW